MLSRHIGENTFEKKKKNRKAKQTLEKKLLNYGLQNM